MLSLCFGRMLWAYALGLCFGPVFWAKVLGLCFGPMFQAYALGVCFECMALERMTLGGSLWVRGFGNMSLRGWILPKKLEAKY